MRIIYFDIDSLRPDHLGCYGYNRPTSPNIDAIAEQGTCFDNYYCSSSPCLPSRTGFVSGRFGIRNGVISNHGAGARFQIRLRNSRGPQKDNELFPRQIRTGGYESYCFSNFADRHNAYYFMGGWSQYHMVNLKGGAETAEEINAELLPWLRHNATRENYFLHINYWDVHRTYKMPASWADRFKDHPVPQAWPDEETIAKHQDYTGKFTAQKQFGGGRSNVPLMPGSISSRKDFDHLITGYDASIAYADHHIGFVLDELARQGVLDDAVIIFSADHGEGFGEHGVYSDHVCADECVHRIPLVVRWPGVTKAGSRCDSLLYHVDFPVTICEMLGIHKPEDWDGESFAENLKGNKGLERDYLVWDHGLYVAQRAVRTRSHLMLRTYHNHPTWLGPNAEPYDMEPIELYDMRSDPYQTRNIRDDNPEIVEQYGSYLTNWVQDQRDKGHCIPDPLMEIVRERGAEPQASSCPLCGSYGVPDMVDELLRG